MSCKEPLIYFGREAVDLSEQSILDVYDILHPYQQKRILLEFINRMVQSILIVVY